MGTQSAPPVPQLGDLLRYWRQQRGKSQLDLSMDTGIAQRQLSFVERGRSSPSRDFLSIVSDALNVPLRERNALLLAAGFAPQYSKQSMDAEQMDIVTQAIDRMLQQHEPHPALVLDRHCRSAAKGPPGSGRAGAGCETPGTAEAVEAVSRRCSAKPPIARQSPVLPIVFRRGSQRFSYFSLITTVGTPQCITAQELRVESMFPTNAEERSA